MTQFLELRGLRLLASIGVLDSERIAPQPIELDADVELVDSPAGVSDDLADTLDYGSLCDQLAAVVDAGHVDLLEHLADLLAERVASHPEVAAVDLTVRKLRPPVAHDLDTAGIRVVRRR